MLVAGIARHWKSLSHTPLCLTTDPAQGVYIELIAFGYYASDSGEVWLFGSAQKNYELLLHIYVTPGRASRASIQRPTKI